MKKKLFFIVFFSLIFFYSCSDKSAKDSEVSDEKKSEAYSEANGESMSKSESVSTNDVNVNGNQTNTKPGTITAGEWNDLQNWDFWKKIFEKDYINLKSYWTINPFNRVSVLVKDNNSLPLAGIEVILFYKKEKQWVAQTDNYGMAELFLKTNDTSFMIINSAELSLEIDNGNKKVTNVLLFEKGINTIKLTSNSNIQDKLEVCFVVDATGSMGDELEFLKVELVDVIRQVQSDNPKTTILTSSVFYRDAGDEYVTRKSDFSDDVFKTIEFIKNQKADGGGDFPEAVHSALDEAVNNLQWSEKAKSKIIFIVLDAPPHFDNKVIENLYSIIKKSAEKGIKIIPIVASGIDKETEFLMRFMSIMTNGTYVFITDDSGIGESHLVATVGSYNVEFLNDLMVRLLNKYLKHERV